MKKITNLFVIAFFTISFVSAQSADAVTKALEAKKITYGQGAYFVATALSLISDADSEEMAINALVNSGYIDSEYKANEIMRNDDFSLLCMKAWNIKGGLFYTLTKSRRYAFREFKSLGFLPFSADPSYGIAGRNALNIMSECSELKGESK
ncbi:MAG: hypothetical protein GX220_03265 [Treponema sp.]|nr:hypothetical protein [Treponema sp.]